MAHLHVIEDNDEVTDVVVFCSDPCHRDWCNRAGNPGYTGWNGCQEISVSEPCIECGDNVEGVMDVKK